MLPVRYKLQLQRESDYQEMKSFDATNPYSSTGTMMDLRKSTTSEEVAKQIPGAPIVKAFNTMFHETLRTRSRKSKDDRLVLYVAGDDSHANVLVSSLIEEIGFTPVDTGALKDGGGKQQPCSAICHI